ncbi:hypothetical protein F5Y13DRAFT_199790 [Hypoxylon sp. FL1857]|nr:hypothetical protein F5Y13DRAFT_199790 [Hypoxylon sp. FL1857]
MTSAPTIMLAALLTGIVFSICHDRFYASFNDQPVSSNLEQRLVTSAGTAFAFIVRTFLTISTATAFPQQIFHDLKRRYETVKKIDMLFGFLGNILYIGNVDFWLRYPVEPTVRNVDGTLLKPMQPQQSWIGPQNFSSCQLDDTAVWKTAEGYTYVDAICTGPSGELYSTTLSSMSQRALPSEDALAMNASVTQARRNYDLPGMHTILGGVNAVRNPDSLLLRYNAWYSSDCFNLTNPNWHNGSASSNCNDNNQNNTDYFFTSDYPQVDTIALLACELYNSTYDIGFNFENSKQVVNVKSITLGDRLVPNNTVDYDLSDYGNIVYTSVFDAFNNVVLSAALNETSTYSATGSVQYYDGIVEVTALRELIEGKRLLSGLDAKNIIEQMFQNITISMMSSPSLRLPEANSTHVNVKTWRSLNVYVYDPRDIYIAYGSASALSMLCVIWGFYIIWYHHRRVSYDLQFSTILRTTRSIEIDSIVPVEDGKGGEPVPKDLLKAKLEYINNEGDGDSYGFNLQHASRPSTRLPTSRSDLETSPILRDSHTTPSILETN